MSGPRTELEELGATFREEFRESLEQYQVYLRQLESSPENPGVLAAFFREIHSLKGAAGFIGFQNLNQVLHKIEDILTRLRNGDMPFNPDILNLFDDGFELLRKLESKISATGKDTVAIASFVKRINRLVGKPQAAAPSAPCAEFSRKRPLPAGSADEISEISEIFFGDADELLQNFEKQIREFRECPAGQWETAPLRKHFRSLVGAARFVEFKEFAEYCDCLETLFSEMEVKTPETTATVITVLEDSHSALSQMLQKKRDGKRPGRKWRHSLSEVHRLIEALRKAGDKKNVSPGEFSPVETLPAKITGRTIRVPVERLDHLMNIVGELVLVRNRILQLFEKNRSLRAPDDSMSDTYDTLDFLISEIQASVLQTRMVPIARVFNQFPHIVRDTAKKFNKKIKLTIEGEDTDVDKSVVEVLGDPLIHILRNAVDHGIESPAERKKLGKSAAGSIVLSARHEGNQIIVQCSDDGRGMDPRIVRQTAVEKQLISAEKARVLSEKDILNLIFLPGFSTSASVNMLSGRGVGMDVVKSNITRLNGFIEFETEIGKGTRFFLHFPLTMAIVQGLLIEVQNEIFILPIHSVLETVRVVDFPIQSVWGHPAIRLRDQVVPVIHLEELFCYDASGRKQQAKYVVIVGYGEKKIGIAADHLRGQREVVIKKMGKFLEETPGFSGASILSDGSVRLIIDVGGLMRLARYENLNAAEVSEAE